jgi:hypothetical protein
MRHHAGKYFRAKSSFPDGIIEADLAASNIAIKNGHKGSSPFSNGVAAFMAVLTVQKIDPKKIGSVNQHKKQKRAGYLSTLPPWPIDVNFL